MPRQHICSRCPSPAYAKGLCRKCYMADWYLAHREQSIARAKNWQAEHHEHHLAQKRAYMARRPREKKLASLKLDRQRHGDRRKAQTRAWCKAHPDRVRAYARAKYRRHTEYYRELVHQYRSRQRNAFVARVDWKAVWKRDRGICQWCRKPVKWNEMGRDHSWPLARGGTHEPRNAQSMHRQCNRIKSAYGPAQMRLW